MPCAKSDEVLGSHRMPSPSCSAFRPTAQLGSMPCRTGFEIRQPPSHFRRSSTSISRNLPPLCLRVATGAIEPLDDPGRK